MTVTMPAGADLRGCWVPGRGMRSRGVISWRPPGNPGGRGLYVPVYGGGRGGPGHAAAGQQNREPPLRLSASFKHDARPDRPRARGPPGSACWRPLGAHGPIACAAEASRQASLALSLGAGVRRPLSAEGRSTRPSPQVTMVSCCGCPHGALGEHPRGGGRGVLGCSRRWRRAEGAGPAWPRGA